ncbi:hypothetical protein, variant 2 [Plasmodium yoelii 17X]|nr:conserved protein, unknown function [Plasmodium yoelii]ETB60107.1 hypothetical protein, variant 2 [Plasmodium yoelii 17X]CDU17691.1 conserved Plasmodium protein, unknown function [Plasmodium yoelii]VTZ77662.1 conserved protein, unknown function [Plasmodium yoelii]|eukprot:XP_022812026.1 conserved protein, unknown function [Plasmodium yoelii]
MGNILGSIIGNKETNPNKTNISIFEKRYGYNLNDLHSYIYQINLPLKPPYINYVFQEKKEKNESMEIFNDKNNDNKTVNDLNNTVDIYNKYDKDNINNSNNIYKNKLIINNVEDNKKHDDKYVHLGYNKNYIFDKNKNNIYTEDNISKYISEQKMDEKNNFDIKKTYLNLCLNYYNNIDTCVTKKYQKNVQNKKYKFTRLHTCKPHYILFSRCVKFRDKKIMKEIKKMELDYYNALSPQNKSSYLSEFSTNLSYHEYRINQAYEGVEKIRLNKELNELRERYNNILKSNGMQ